MIVESGLQADVDPELCIGSGDCTRVAPGAFLLDEDAGVARAVAAVVRSSEPARLVEAARGCPTQAIRVQLDGMTLHASNG